MCGISGIIGPLATKQNISKMTYALWHRGHDAIQYQCKEGNYALGHNRLSIIDLSEAANQPFQVLGYPYKLVFNGEIYNYIEIRQELQYLGINFQTKSDTEVLLQAYIKWGENCLEKFNGMFSFAIYHTDSNKLFIARDRFGVKPLYYYHSKDTLIFASEIKAIRTLISTKVNQSVLANYLVFGSYGLPNESFFEHIHQLAGGHYLTFEYDEIEITRWYDFISRVNVLKESLKDISKEEAKQTYKQKLEKSISLRFRADVPVGFTLSGGVDSSLLLALISQRKDVSKIKAFTFYTGDERYDELPWVEKMVNSTLTNLEKVIFEPKHFDKWHKRISKVQDEPYGGLPTLAYANLFQAMSNKGVKVVLDGQGMDEAWAGYDYYQNNSTHTIQGQKSNPFKLNVLNEVILKEAKEPNYPKPFSDELLDKQYRDLFYTKIPRALRFNDRVSMAATTELREPFLDYNLVEYAFSLPKPLKINKGVGKYLLREILSEYSSEVALAPKRPLQTPQREWLGNELSSTVDRAINQLEKSIYADYFKIDEMKNEWQDYKNGSQDSSFHLWQWISVSELINSAC